VVAFVLLGTAPGWTQTTKPAPQTTQLDIAALKAGQAEMQKDLQEIKLLLQSLSRPAPAAAAAPALPPNLTLSIDGGQIQGDKNARVTLIEYTDYQCPFCAKFVRETFPKLEEEYIKTGKVKYVRKDFPLESIHANAFKAAEAVQCAQESGKGAELHARLFGNQQQLAPAQLAEHAKAVGVDGPAFQSCLDSGKYVAQIRKNMSEAQAAGVTGTPSFFLGISDASGKVKATRALKGAQAYAAFKATIDELLAGTKEIAALVK
jgi:protein-disulfide isomerase